MPPKRYCQVAMVVVKALSKFFVPMSGVLHPSFTVPNTADSDPSPSHKPHSSYPVSAISIATPKIGIDSAGIAAIPLVATHLVLVARGL